MEYRGTPTPSCPNPGVSLCQIPPGLPSPASSSQGAVVMLALVHSARPYVALGLSLVLPLSFRGCGAILDPPPKALLRYVCGWGGPGRLCRGCSVLGRTPPPPPSVCFFFGKMNLALFSY